MSDVNFGHAHSIEFWYITRHGFQHVSEKKDNKKEPKNVAQEKKPAQSASKVSIITSLLPTKY